MRKLHRFSRSRSHSRQNSNFSPRESVEIEPAAATANALMNPSTHKTPTRNLVAATSAASRPPPSLTLHYPNSGPTRMPSTIRPVPSFDASDSSTTSTCDSPPAHDSAFSSSTNSARSNISSYQNHDSTPTISRLKHSPTVTAPERPLLLSPPSGNGITRRGTCESSQSNPADSPQSSPAGHDADEPPGQEAWDSSVGKAGLGKTGRVINKLVSDNEALKRDLKIERIKAEEAKQAAKLLEDKMERMAADYEARMLEAQVTKTLLARKERQVETLSDQVGLEKKKAIDALGREKNWRDEMEKSGLDAKRRVEEAENRVLMTEGRYNAISSHWKDQGDAVSKATVKLRADIAKLVDERRKDDEKITVLRDLCEQQDVNIRELDAQKEAIQAAFRGYKAEQERSLRHIKTGARESEKEQERMLIETKEVLDKLKWALNVKQLGLGG